jgi:hypothetical protein
MKIIDSLIIKAKEAVYVQRIVVVRSLHVSMAAVIRRELLWRFCVASNKKTYSGLHVK